MEAGLAMSFFQNRLGFDVAYYKTNTVNQIIPVAVSAATGYATKVVNAGEIQNQGVELIVNIAPVVTSDFRWDIALNWSRNRNEVLSLYEDATNMQLGRFQGGISINATVGQPFGTIMGTDYVYEGTDGNYKEKDSLKPFTKYGWSKLGGECAVQMYDNHLILRMAMNKKPFPHPKALIDMKKSLMWIEDAAKTTLKLLDETGIVNVGGKSQSVYDFVKEENPKIKPIVLDDIPDVNMATDCSMDTTKLKMLLKMKRLIDES